MDSTNYPLKNEEMSAKETEALWQDYFNRLGKESTPFFNEKAQAIVDSCIKAANSTNDLTYAFDRLARAIQISQGAIPSRLYRGRCDKRTRIEDRAKYI